MVSLLQNLHPMQERVLSLAFDLVSNILETGPVSSFLNKNKHKVFILDTE